MLYYQKQSWSEFLTFLIFFALLSCWLFVLLWYWLSLLLCLLIFLLILSIYCYYNSKICFVLYFCQITIIIYRLVYQIVNITWFFFIIIFLQRYRENLYRTNLRSRLMFYPIYFNPFLSIPDPLSNTQHISWSISELFHWIFEHLDLF